MSENDRPHKLFLTIFTALTVLGLLAMCPWASWTGGWLKDINPLTGDDDGGYVAEVPVDPELALLEAEAEADTVTVTESVAEAEAVSDTPEPGSGEQPLPDDFAAPSVGGTILIEDYSSDRSGLARLAASLDAASQRPVRIAMIGDSYIEGDILSQDIRSALQESYGGSGVGYVGAWTQFPGFRSSVNQSGPKWRETMIADMKGSDPWRTILGRYHVAGAEAVSHFAAGRNHPHAEQWELTRVLFEAPSAGTVTLASGDSVLATASVAPDPGHLQELTAAAPGTKKVTFRSDIPSLRILGLWLESRTGIILDNISLRGNSGLGHRTLSENATAELRRSVDYDLIILEFGLNVASPGQRNYDTYRRGLTAVIENLLSLYPRVQILIFGAGDRAVKQSGELQSMATLPALIRAQREAARATGSLFYDTRAAMGGEGAAIDWHSRKLINADYIHLNHKGGKVLAEIFINSLHTSIP